MPQARTTLASRGPPHPDSTSDATSHSVLLLLPRSSSVFQPLAYRQWTLFHCRRPHDNTAGRAHCLHSDFPSTRDWWYLDFRRRYGPVLSRRCNRHRPQFGCDFDTYFLVECSQNRELKLRAMLEKSSRVVRMVSAPKSGWPKMPSDEDCQIQAHHGKPQIQRVHWKCFIALRPVARQAYFLIPIKTALKKNIYRKGRYRSVSLFTLTL